MSSAAAGLRLTLLLSNPGTFFAEISTLGISGPSLIHNAAWPTYSAGAALYVSGTPASKWMHGTKTPPIGRGLSREGGSSPPSMRRADSILSKQCSRAEAGYVLQWPVISSQGIRRLLTAFLQAKAFLGQRSVEWVPLMPQLFSVFSHAVSEPRSGGEKRACQPALALA